MLYHFRFDALLLDLSPPDRSSIHFILFSSVRRYRLERLDWASPMAASPRRAMCQLAAANLCSTSASNAAAGSLHNKPRDTICLASASPRFPPPPNNPSETCPRFPTSRHVFRTHTYNMRGEQYSIGALSLIVCVISNTLLVLQHPEGTAYVIFYVILSCDQARPLIPSAPLTVVSPHNVVSCRRAILKGIRQRHEVIIIIITIIIITGWSLQVKSSSSSSSLS